MNLVHLHVNGVFEIIMYSCVRVDGVCRFSECVHSVIVTCCTILRCTIIVCVDVLRLSTQQVLGMSSDGQMTACSQILPLLSVSLPVAMSKEGRNMRYITCI